MTLPTGQQVRTELVVRMYERACRAGESFTAEVAAMTCYLCDEPITGPAVPRRHEETGEQILLCPACWEMCVGCCAPVGVFEPIAAFAGNGLPLIMRDHGDRLLAEINGVRLHLCPKCAPS